MRAARTLSMLLLLQARGRLSASELAELLEVSVRTVHRDIDQLNAAGVPVYAVRGRDGGFELLPGWHTQLSGLTNLETDMLALGALPGVAQALGLRQALAGAEIKVAAARVADPATLRSRLHIDPNRWFYDEEQPAHLQLLLHAAMTDHRVRLTYRHTARQTKTQIDPLGVVLKAGVWYVVALDRSRQRTYRLSQIESVEVIDHQFQRPDGFDLAQAWTTARAQYESSIVTGSARIRATSAALRRLAAASGTIARILSTDLMAPSTVEQRVVTIPIESTDDAIRLLLAPDIEVLDPPELRREMQEAALATARQYSFGGNS
jgi:predicted DNA-binding transcriptional regulator YafY